MAGAGYGSVIYRGKEYAPDVPEKVVTIEVFGGLVSDVKGLPEGWTYKVVDHDVEEVE